VLSTQAHDRAVAAASVRLARTLVLSGSFALKHGPVSEHVPGAHLETDEELATAAGNIATSIFHPVRRHSRQR